MKIAFVYAGGREARLEAARLGNAPTDFFYGAIEMERDGHVIQVHDLPAVPSKFSRYLNRFVRRWLPPKTQVPDIFAAGKLLHLLQDCDAVIATTSGTAFALGIWKKLGKLPARLIGIHCGIVNCRHDLPRAKSAAAILKAMTPVLFADNEASEMENQFGGPKPASVWFGVDEEYWNPGPVVRTRNGVLAVGNDGRRDYETLLKTATLLPEVSFKIVTRISLGQDLPPNVKHLHGDWSTDAVSDETLREFYRSAACVAVPLHESIQPSGQSVAMQAMMCGAPVVMTRTPGWWGAEVLRSGEHLFEVPPKNPEALAAAIRQAACPGLLARQALLAAGWTGKGFAKRLGGIFSP